MTHDTSILLHPVRILTRSVRRIAAMFKQPYGKLRICFRLFPGNPN